MCRRKQGVDGVWFKITKRSHAEVVSATPIGEYFEEQELNPFIRMPINCCATVGESLRALSRAVCKSRFQPTTLTFQAVMPSIDAFLCLPISTRVQLG